MKKILAINFIVLSVLDVVFFILVSNISMSAVLFCIIYNILISFVLYSLPVLYDKIGIIISIIIILFLMFAYLFEISMFTAYNNLFPLVTIFSSAKDVLKNYYSEMIQIILHNIVIFVIFIIIFAFIVYFLFTSKVYKQYIKDKTFHSTVFYICMALILVIPFATKSSNNYTMCVFENGIKYSLLSSLIEKKEEFVNIDIESKDEIDDKDEKINNDIEIDDVLDEEINRKNYNVTDIDFDKLYNAEKNENLKNLYLYLNNVKPSKKNKYTGVLKGKNVILICAEAFSHHIIDPGLTPTLNMLLQNGIKMDEFYVPSWGGSTTAGEYSFLTGLIAPSRSYTMELTIGKNMALTLPRVLKKFGYITVAFHNGDYTYYNRDLTHKQNLGFDEFYAIGNGIENFAGAWPNDIDMIDKTLREYIDKKPFCLYYMTATGHAFYDNDDSYKVVKYIDRVKEKYGDTYSKQVNNYLCAQLYLEDALKNMLDILKDNGLYDDTVICLVSDHFPYGLTVSNVAKDQDFMDELYGGYKKDNIERDLNMPILWSSCLSKKFSPEEREINTPTYVVDLLPTLLNMFGVSFDSRLLPGRDVFSDANPMVVYNNGTFITDKVKYSSLTKERYWGKNKNDDSYFDKSATIANNKEKFSYEVLDLDLYNNLSINRNISEGERYKYDFHSNGKDELEEDALE